VSAAAEAVGELTPLVGATATSAKATASKLTDAPPTACAPAVVPSQLAAVLNLNAACSTSLAEIVNGVPHAHSEGSVAGAGLMANTVLSQLNQVSAIGQTLSSALQPIVKAINDATGQNIALDPGQTLSQLINDLTQTQTLALSLGSSTSDVRTTAAAVTALATDKGGSIDIFPVDVLNHTPLASITIGSAQSQVVYDRATGKATPSFDPALVTVDVAPLAGLPVGALHQKVTPGQTLTILGGTPLESTIIVGDGRSLTAPDGSVHAVADGVSLQLVKGLDVGQGGKGITLELAHAETAGQGALAVNDTPKVSASSPPPPALPRTGETLPWLPVAGAVLAGGVLVVRRFAISRR